MSVQAGFVSKKLIVAVTCLVAVAISFFIVAEPWIFPERHELSLEALESKYATPDSHFVDLDGVRLHYMDQGSGPAVVLVHASFMTLRSWDSLAEALSSNYRVIRLDLLASGLTGPERNDRYSYERNLQLVEQLTQHLGVSKFALVGTSSGGIVAFNYTARHPDQVTRLVLINSAGLPRNSATDPNRSRGNPIMAWLQRRYQSRSMVRDTLDTNFIEPHEPPEALVDRSYDMRLREGLKREGQLLFASFETGDPQTVLGQVKAPTLIIWGLENRTVFHLQADIFQGWLSSAPTLLKKYPDVGHYLYFETPELFNADVADFLAGRFDEQLRIREPMPYVQVVADVPE
jgi:pimeloyl-ACP methyl ester carboxylesterase